MNGNISIRRARYTGGMATDLSIPAALAIDGIAGADARTAFDVAAASGYRGIAFGTNHRELNPRELGESGRRHLRTILSGKHLRVESLRVAIGKGGLADARMIDAGLNHARETMTLARELGVRMVSVNVGTLGGTGGNAVPEGTLVSALRELAQQADAAGVTLALGADSTPKLAGLLKQVDFEGAKMNLEGARTIGAAEDPLKLAEEYGGMMAQFTASDAVRSGAGAQAGDAGGRAVAAGGIEGNSGGAWV